MAQLNTVLLSRTLLSTAYALGISDPIVAGDSTGAYVLELTFSDVLAITGTCQLYFELGTNPKTYATRDASNGVVISGNKITYPLEEVLYSAADLICWVQFTDDAILHTVLKIAFVGIVVPNGGVSTDSLVSYPAWVSSVASAEALRVIAESARVIADGLRLTVYETAVDAGYADTEANFLLDLAAIEGLAAGLAAL